RSDNASGKKGYEHKCRKASPASAGVRALRISRPNIQVSRTNKAGSSKQNSFRQWFLFAAARAASFVALRSMCSFQVVLFPLLTKTIHYSVIGAHDHLAVSQRG